MSKYGDYSKIDRDRQRIADIKNDFRRGASLTKVCRRLGWSTDMVKKALCEGRLLGIQFTRNKLRTSPTNKMFERDWVTNIRYPAWQFEAKIRRSLPKILNHLKNRFYQKDNDSKFDFFDFYQTARDFLFTENHQLQNRKPVDLLRGNQKDAKQVMQFFTKD